MMNKEAIHSENSGAADESARLYLSIKLVYDDCLSLSDEISVSQYSPFIEPFPLLCLVKLISYKIVCCVLVIRPSLLQIVAVEPAAGSLSSSNLYPACRTPYLVVLACDDERVRFYECVRHFSTEGISTYVWRKWGMIGDPAESDIEMDGKQMDSSFESRMHRVVILQ